MTFEGVTGPLQRPRRGPGRGRGRGRPARRSEARTDSRQRKLVQAWIAGRVPAGWGVDPKELRIDNDEVLVRVHLPAVELPEDSTAEARGIAEEARISGFRSESRSLRVEIAKDAQASLGRIVSWGAVCGGTERRFTTASVPVMTRLRIDERLVLDTLVDSGVARSRSDALAWCVRLVGRNEQPWIADLRSAFERVEDVRSRGPDVGEGS